MMDVEHNYDICDADDWNEAMYWVKANDLLWDDDKRENFIIRKQIECQGE